jgi:hypothetical protein
VRIYFSHKKTGAKNDFIWEDGSLIVGDLGSFDWHLSDLQQRRGCVISASEAAGLNAIVAPSAPQARFWTKHTHHPAWHKILSRELFGAHLRDQVDQVTSFLLDEKHGYFTGAFQIQQELLDSLCRSAVRDGSLAEHGFVPKEDGTVDVPKYDNVHSATGRMSIKEGPRILILQRDLRKKIRSRWDDGELIEIDFNGLEARVLGWISGNDIGDDDAYTWIGKEAGFVDTPRAVIKEATLSAIYGMSKRNFALRYQDTPDAVEIYEAIRRLMRVKQLDDRLREMQDFSNAFGRPLGETSARISHHVQSSAVDVACSGFLGLVKNLDAEIAKPVFLIHDAIVLDVKKHAIPEIESICKSGLNIDIIDRIFPVKMRRFGDE